MTTTLRARSTKTVLGLFAALGIAVAGLAALPAGEAAARPCQLPREPAEERPVCSNGRAAQFGGIRGGMRDILGRPIGEEIPTRYPVEFGGLAGGIGGDSRPIVIPQ